MQQKTSVRLGTYKHFKGTTYKVIHVARDADTLENVVIYVDVEFPEKVWARKETDFLSPKIINGVEHERFVFLMG